VAAIPRLATFCGSRVPRIQWGIGSPEIALNDPKVCRSVASAPNGIPLGVVFLPDEPCRLLQRSCAFRDTNTSTRGLVPRLGRERRTNAGKQCAASLSATSAHLLVGFGQRSCGQAFVRCQRSFCLPALSPRDDGQGVVRHLLHTCSRGRDAVKPSTPCSCWRPDPIVPDRPPHINVEAAGQPLVPARGAAGEPVGTVEFPSADLSGHSPHISYGACLKPWLYDCWRSGPWLACPVRPPRAQATEPGAPFPAGAPGLTGPATAVRLGHSLGLQTASAFPRRRPRLQRVWWRCASTNFSADVHSLLADLAPRLACAYPSFSPSPQGGETLRLVGLALPPAAHLLLALSATMPLTQKRPAESAVCSSAR